MKRLYVCGSFRFAVEIEQLELKFKEEGIECQVSKKMDSRGILDCLRRIDESDIVYVFNPKGYVGKSVSVDIGYAYAKNKTIFAIDRVDDPPVMDLVSAVLSPKELIDSLKGDSGNTNRAA